MLALCSTLAVVLAANPEAGVVKRSTTGVPEGAVARVLNGVIEGLLLQSLDARMLSPACSPEPKCLAQTARESGLVAAVAVTIVRGRKDLTVDLEAVDAQERQLAVQTFGVPLAGSPFPAEGAEFFRRLKKALPVSPEDAPRVVTLAPKPVLVPEPEPVVEAVRVAPGQRLMRATGVTAVGTGAAGVGLLIAGLVAKGQLDARLQGSPVSGITRPEAQSQANLANALGTASVVTLAIAGAAAVTTGVLWLNTRGDAEENSD